jgi:hypothetical protein
VWAIRDSEEGDVILYLSGNGTLGMNNNKHVHSAVVVLWSEDMLTVGNEVQGLKYCAYMKGTYTGRLLVDRERVQILYLSETKTG